MLARFLVRALKARYRNERAEIKAILEALSPGEIALDVGAYKGSYLLWLSRAVGPGSVVAFEPQPNLTEYVRRACLAARLGNVTVEAVGVSDHSTSLPLHMPVKGDNPGASFERGIQEASVCRDLVVPVVSLDDYFAARTRRIGAIKVDVEGHEMAVFRGARSILERDRPLLVFESENRHLGSADVTSVLRFLKDQGYGGFFVRRSRLVPIEEFDPQIHQKRGAGRFWALPDYCNNFILSRA
jgi:FkbM family methyltransferase